MVKMDLKYIKSLSIKKYDYLIPNEKYAIIKSFSDASGKTFEEGDVFPENIVILNHKGELQKHIQLDGDHLAMKFTLVGDSIYAVGLDQITKLNWKEKLM